MKKTEAISIGVIFFAALISTMQYANTTIETIRIVRVLNTVPGDDNEKVPDSWFEENQSILQSAAPSDLIQM